MSQNNRIVMNKRGRIESIVFLPILLMIIMMLCFMFMLLKWSYDDSKIESCKTYRNLKLESVNGVYDKDTGLFAGGSVSEKTLLFSNGLIMTLKNYEVKTVDLRLGKEYDIKKCEMKSGRVTHEVLK